MTSASAERLSRLLALVPWLQAHPGISLDDCASHFGITVEQLESDLWMIVVCGIPGYGPDQLVDIQFWDGTIDVLDALTLDAPLRLSPDEAVTLLIGLRLLAQVPGVEGRSDLVSAAAKLEALTDGSTSGLAVVVPVDPDVRIAVDSALSSGQALALRYAAATSDEVTERTVIPERVHASDTHPYLEAWCTSAEAHRTFRLDRVLQAHVVPVPAGAWPASSDDERPLTAVTLRLAPGARWLTDVVPGVVSDPPGADGSVTARMHVRDLEWAARLVLSQGGKVQAVAPEALVTLVSGAAAAALASYS